MAVYTHFDLYMYTQQNSNNSSMIYQNHTGLEYFNPYAFCQEGQSSLMVASQEGHVEVVDKLLQHGATVDLLDDRVLAKAGKQGGCTLLLLTPPAFPPPLCDGTSCLCVYYKLNMMPISELTAINAEHFMTICKIIHALSRLHQENTPLL